ncbi:DUF3099 domain-containing protein [Rhodococcus kronopolitis]|uniref:DUF3099 domain-containing protein n=1 Tax=Rhodococcus kronopolitis TaxID=1460226 RepID=A0ABV9FNE8_9NOCA
MASSSGFFRQTDPGDDDSAQNPVLITDAAQSFQDQQRARIRKYTILMAFRIPALVLAAIAYGEWHNGWISLLIIGVSIPLPWIAVLVANDRPPRRSDEPRRYDHRAPTPPQIEPPDRHTIEG